MIDAHMEATGITFEKEYYKNNHEIKWNFKSILSLKSPVALILGVVVFKAKTIIHILERGKQL